MSDTTRSPAALRQDWGLAMDLSDAKLDQREIRMAHGEDRALNPRSNGVRAPQTLRGANRTPDWGAPRLSLDDQRVAGPPRLDGVRTVGPR
jgi:hypothetical protein